MSKAERVELTFLEVHEHGVNIAGLWMREVTSRTGGSVVFKKSPGQSPESADVIRDVPAKGGVYHLLDLVQTPFVFRDATGGSRAVAQLYAEFPEMRREMSDCKVAGLGTGALMGIFSTAALGPIRALEDLKGARIRSLAPIDSALKALGAEPRYAPYPDIGKLMAAGDLDAAVIGLNPAMIFKLAEGPAPYCTIAPGRSITMHPMRLYLKWDAWHRLPEEAQKTIEKIGPAGAGCWFAVQSGQDADAHVKEALDYVKERGHIFELAPGEMARWRRAVQPAADEAIGAVEVLGLPGIKFHKRMLELAEKYAPPG